MGLDGAIDGGVSLMGHRKRMAYVGITREDGKKQTTFRGYPLYYWAGDKAPGDTKGQGMKNVWYVIDPAKFPPKK